MAKCELTGAEIYDLCHKLVMLGWVTMSKLRRGQLLLDVKATVKADEIDHCVPLLGLPRELKHSIPNGVAAAREVMPLGKTVVLAKMERGDITSATTRDELRRMRGCAPAHR